MNTAHITGSWKTTVMGLLIAMIGAAPALTAMVRFDQAGHFDMTPQAWVQLAAAVLVLIHGALMPDPDKQLSQAPGVPTPTDEPAHKIPDDPANKAVTGQ